MSPSGADGGLAVIQPGFGTAELGVKELKNPAL
jgi:hypothetical protein